jgi:diguanylate cyclase (GGDEF)-like protein
MQGIVMYDDTGNPYQVIGKTIDIDASKQQYLKLQEETTHDNLTQLFNTNTLSTKINAILQEKLPSQEATLLFLDLDRFKILVDHYGQLAADEILSKTALLLHDTFPGQIIGRVGNDQFVVFLSDTNNLEEIDQKAEAVCQHVREMKIDAVDDVHVTCSIGYFSTKASDFTFEIMLLRANVAVRAMKSKGGNGCELYGSLKHSYSITNEAIDNQKRNYYDRLTGLYSLPAFILEGETQMDQKQDKKIAIVYFDINSFRIFNANYGFTIGNKILKYFARVLEEEKRENEMCCHVEKDEFVCMLYYDTAQDLALRFTDMKTHFSATNMNIEDYFRLNFTCGVYFSTGEREDLASMIDKANYARKATKGVTEVSHYAVYNGDTEKKAKKQLAIEASIEQAMKNEEIVPFFQPQYSLHTEQMVGIEALARWKTTDGTSLLPEDFFPVLEENGFIVELDFYIIEQTLKIFKSWMEKGLPLFPVSFNISGSHLLTTNFVERLVALMTQYSVPINYLELEISEKVFVTSPETTVFLVQELKDLGFKIILDDFGREFSAINSLKDLDIDGVKLDTAFFNGKIRKEKERIIFKKIIEMAKELKLSVSSEGVETTLQAEQLKDFGCDFAQGFLFHNPMSATEFEEYILTRMKP